ncbi:uncharacterized protein L201_003772 [Kwoniella dendrophila CBS 6074]|uniref:C2H2-type domain-containing protein n=1 Tax=Kwoniella dendrophila CBS 6074 TaxID=1295534 RepID=A0AAX4JW82_9TREE
MTHQPPYYPEPYPCPPHPAPGMTLHPPQEASTPYVNFYPALSGLHTYGDIGTIDEGMNTIEEGEEEIEDISNYGNRPNRKKKIPAQYNPPSRATLSKSKGKGKSNNQSRSRSSSIIPNNEMDISSTTAIFLPDPYLPPIQLKGVSKSGLLPAPEGCILDVNDLLLLHPPEKVSEGLQGHRSQYEMYTCRVCSKTYDGKNARSVARRHLQDKHGVPLSVQKRRSRWDYEPDRPKSQEDAKERNLKAKRDWVNRHRQIQKLEKTHEAFLERFGPSGITTPCGMQLVAPKYRGETEAQNDKKKRFLDGSQGNVIIPEGILRGIEAIKDMKGGTKYTAEPSNIEKEPDLSLDMNEGKIIIKKGKAKKSTSRGTVVSSTSTSQSEFASRSTTPLRTVSSNHGSPTHGHHHPHYDNTTPAGSSTRAMLTHPPQQFPWQSNQPLQPASMVLINGQYHFTLHPQYQDYPIPASHYQDRQSVEYIQEAHVDEESLPSSPPEETVVLPAQQWVPSGSWSKVQPEPQQHEPALDITQQWQGLHLNSWPSAEDGKDAEHKIKEGSVETEGEAVAAESLLNLHSTPLRGPDENGRNEIQIARAQAKLELLPPVVPTKDENENVNTKHTSDWANRLLSAPDIESPTRPRPSRSSSFIQPFRDPRPEVTRSLSFDARSNLEDPFVLADTPARPSSAGGFNKPTPLSTSSSMLRRNKRHTISMPSPSPLSSSSTSAFKKRKEAPISPAAPASSSMGRAALKPISTNINSMNIKPNYAGSFATPIKPSSSSITSAYPQSVTKEWLQFSSPNGPDAAMSLGLAPTHFAPTTPGIRGMIGADTPELTILEARNKKRRSEDLPTPKFAFGLSSSNFARK